MDIIEQSILGILPFFTHLGAALVLLGVFILIYVKITPYDEIKLIRTGNSSAAASLSGAVLGFAIPLANAAAQSGNFLDMLLWAGIALVVQLVAYVIVRLLIPSIAKDIPEGHVAQGVFLGVLSLAIGILSAACMADGL